MKQVSRENRMNRRHLALATGLALLSTAAGMILYAAQDHDHPDLSFAHKTDNWYTIHDTGSVDYKEIYSLKGVPAASRLSKVGKVAKDAGFTLNPALSGGGKVDYTDGRGRSLTFYPATAWGPQLMYCEAPVSRLRSIVGPMLLRLRNRNRSSEFTLIGHKTTVLSESLERSD
jgi:hypothetical protein